MGLLDWLTGTKRQDIGFMRFDYYSRNELYLTDSIPAPTEQFHFPIAFAFLLAGRLLWNVSKAAKRDYEEILFLAASKFGEELDLGAVLENNISLAATFAPSGVARVENRGPGRWVYRGDLFMKNESLLVDSKISVGDEVFFHGASVDLAFECARTRCGTRGGTVAFAVFGFVGKLLQARQGSLTLSEFIGVASTWGGLATALAGLPEDEFRETVAGLNS